MASPALWAIFVASHCVCRHSLKNNSEPGGLLFIIVYCVSKMQPLPKPQKTFTYKCLFSAFQAQTLEAECLSFITDGSKNASCLGEKPELTIEKCVQRLPLKLSTLFNLAFTRLFAQLLHGRCESSSPLSLHEPGLEQTLLLQ